MAWSSTKAHVAKTSIRSWLASPDRMPGQVPVPIYILTVSSLVDPIGRRTRVRIDRNIGFGDASGVALGADLEIRTAALKLGRFGLGLPAGFDTGNGKTVHHDPCQ